MNNLTKAAIILLVFLALFACTTKSTSPVIHTFNLPDTLFIDEDSYFQLYLGEYINFDYGDNFEISWLGNENIHISLYHFTLSFYTEFDDWYGQEDVVFQIEDTETGEILQDFVCVVFVPDNFVEIVVQNLSTHLASYAIYAPGAPHIHFKDIDAEGSIHMVISDGVHDIQVHGGAAILEYTHILGGCEVTHPYFVDLTLNNNYMMNVHLINNWGCLNMINNSQNSEVWVDIVNDSTVTISPESHFAEFYEPAGLYISKELHYAGYTVFPDSVSITVWEDEYDSLSIEPDGACFWLENNSSANISEIYFSPSSDSTWGDSYISSSILPGETITWTCTSEMEWDILLVDESGNQEALYNNLLHTDDIFTYSYTGLRTGEISQSPDLKTLNSNNKTTTTWHPRVERIWGH